MHEMALAIDIVDTVVRAATEGGETRVKTITLTIGDGRDIVPDMFVGAVEFLARNTIAEGALVVLNTVPNIARCDACGFTYALDKYNQAAWACPMCGERAFTEVSGMEFQLDSIEVE